MSNPVCLVSGSSSGIGASIVREFAAHSYDVVINYHSGAERAGRIASALESEFGVRTLVAGADLSAATEPFRLVDAAYDHFGRLDVVISNSGVSSYVKNADGRLQRYRFHETPVEHLEREFNQVLELNLKGAYRLAQRGLHYMIRQAQAEQEAGLQLRHRSLLFVTSISDVAPDSTRVPYGVTKAGLNHAVLGAAMDAGPYHITVNAIRPGVVDTPLTARPSGLHAPDDGHEYTVAETYALMAQGGSQAIPRIATPEEIAYAAYAFTHIPFMTGQLIAVDGGFTLASGFANRETFLQAGLQRRHQQDAR